MRQEKRLKRWMKEYLSKRGLKADNWRYISFTPPNRLIIIHKHSLQPREVEIMNTTSQFTRITNS